MKLLIKKTEPLLLSLRLTHLFLHLWKKQIVMDITDSYYPSAPVVPFIKATQDRVVPGDPAWLYPADAVSVRQVCSTVRPESVMWIS